jgi:hypothetical protein
MLGGTSGCPASGAPASSALASRVLASFALWSLPCCAHNHASCDNASQAVNPDMQNKRQTFTLAMRRMHDPRRCQLQDRVRLQGNDRQRCRAGFSRMCSRGELCAGQVWTDRSAPYVIVVCRSQLQACACPWAHGRCARGGRSTLRVARAALGRSRTGRPGAVAAVLSPAVSAARASESGRWQRRVRCPCRLVPA